MAQKIFFTGAVRGGRSHHTHYTIIAKKLERYGTVLSQHVSDHTLSTYGETQLDSKEILMRELQNLQDSDIVVADVTVPSLGVGYLIAYATSLGKKVIALYYGDDALKLSGIIKGDALVECYTYHDDAQIDTILKQTLSSCED